MDYNNLFDSSAIQVEMIIKNKIYFKQITKTITCS